MTRPSMTATRRPGFTLVELLVAMAVIVALAAIALIVVPDVLTQDRTTDGAGTVRQTLMIAKARALRDKGPRGVRFLVGSDPANVVKYNAGAAGQLWVTEMQFIEKPPPLTPADNEYLEIVFSTAADGTIQTTAPNDPKVYYHPPTAPAAADLPDPGTPIRAFINGEIAQNRNTYIEASLGDERMTLIVSKAATATLDNGTRQGAPRSNAYLVQLDTTDAAATGAMYASMMRALGGGTSVKLTTFRVERPAQPLLGEQSVPLPKNVCVDLNFGVSRPEGTAGRDYDVVFAPSGEVLSAAVDQVYLWVRDYTKVADMAPVTPTAANPNQAYTYAGLDQFQRGGEQQVVSLKTKSGAVGVFPVQWPQADGTYPQLAPGLYDDPFGFARRAAQ